jgi:hypothetical protein
MQAAALKREAGSGDRGAEAFIHNRAPRRHTPLDRDALPADDNGVCEVHSVVRKRKHGDWEQRQPPFRYANTTSCGASVPSRPPKTLRPDARMPVLKSSPN